MQALMNATQSNMEFFKAKTSARLQVTNQTIDNNGQSLANLVSSVPSGERISKDSMSPRGNVVDIKV